MAARLRKHITSDRCARLRKKQDIIYLQGMDTGHRAFARAYLESVSCELWDNDEIWTTKIKGRQKLVGWYQGVEENAYGLFVKMRLAEKLEYVTVTCTVDTLTLLEPSLSQEPVPSTPRKD